MKERPILFSAPMVRAILDGRKTQTRQIVKPQPPACVTNVGVLVNSTNNDAEYLWMHGASVDDHSVGDWFRCPYGNPGDRLWVRETWQYGSQVTPGMMLAGKMSRRHVVYAATVEDGGHPPSWRPSIHMPRWASRLTLAIKAVRVERVREIRLEDCAAEGAPPTHPADKVWDSTDTYREIWESINGPGSWAKNPWVWVIEFERAKCAGASE